MITTTLSRSMLAGLVALAALGCQETRNPVATEMPEGESATIAPVGDGIAAPADAVLGQQLADLRRLTARFHDFEAADDAGYDILVTHPTSGAACLEHPTEGGMGRHYLKLGLVDAEVAVLEPEVVMYEPMRNGRLRLVGFEYIIPYTIRPREATPPVLFGQDFLHNDVFGLWMLHVYVWKNNPSGMFATWNPKITCEHDGAVD